MNTSIFDLIQSDNVAFVDINKIPYVARGGNNHYDLFCNSTRPARRLEHGLNHCFAMAEHYCDCGQYPLSCDWVVAAAGIASSEAIVLPRIFALWSKLSPAAPETWSELLRYPPPLLGKRLLALTIVRLYVATTFEFQLEHNTRFIEFMQTGCLDVLERLKIHGGIQPFEQIRVLRTLDTLVLELLQPVREAAAATDLRSVVQRVHAITRALNDGLIKGLMTLHLPQSFTKTTLPAVFKAVEPLLNSQNTRFIDLVQFARTEISEAKNRLREHPSFYAAAYIIPLINNLSHLVDQAYLSSDATKPSRLSVNAYPRKYPFHSRDGRIRLRFVIENHGPGPATDIAIHFMFFEDIAPCETTIHISELSVGRQAVDLDVVVGEVLNSIEFHTHTTWQNADATSADDSADGVLLCQNANVNWNDLIHDDPYSIEAIDLESDRPFVGREADVQQLLRMLAGKSMGSAYIYGQKRVGKTSLALEVASRAEDTIHALRLVYLEGGDYVQPTAEGTLQSLGRQIAKRIQKLDRKLERIPMPNFTDSLSPLNEFIDEVLETLPDSRFLVLLDEFDELPLDLYKRGPVGDGFFLTLRSLSGRARVSIILIGGEKIGPIISAQGEQLNRFQPFRVDYFGREEHWGDFQDLVRKPVSSSIEFSEGAIECVYGWSAGNPFFTNVICKEVLQRCCDRRDAFVSELEIEDCANLACGKAGANSFAHFWEDGVLDTGANTETVSIRRRRILLALAATLRAGRPCVRENLAEQRDLIAMGPGAIDSELKSFVERGVLLERQGAYSCRVLMFERFLTERSAELISTEFTDRDERRMVEQEENDAYVQSSEIERLVQSWGTYGPRPASEERVRGWLNQFHSNLDQRVMFQLLKSLRFYSEATVREKLRSAMSYIGKETIRKLREGERSRRDILISYLDGVAKSGTQYARMFCQENKILVGNVASWESLDERLRTQKDELQAVVVIDDMIGTGGTAVESLIALNERVGGSLRSAGITLFLVVICGFQDAIDKVEKKAKELELPLRVFCSDILCDNDRAFGEGAVAFASEKERLRARELARERGEELEPKWPLGHGNCEALVVFFANCPNNTLPILYKDGTKWTALFPRR